MKKLIIFFLILFNSNTPTHANEDCLTKYKESSQKKHDRYSRDSELFIKNKNTAQSNIVLDQYRGSITGNGVISSIYLQNSTPPKVTDYDIFEDEILKAVSVDLKINTSQKPKLLEDIYTSAMEKYSDVTYEKIQQLILKGFLTHKFCGFLGKTRESGIERFVLSELKQIPSDSIFERGPAVIDSDTKLKEPQDQNKELNRQKTSQGYRQ